MKLHFGCGAVYLRPGWLNIDVQSPETFLAKQRPDLVEKWATTDDAYYAKHGDKTVEALREGPLHQECVCDRYGTFADVKKIAVEPVTHVLARHVWEHQSITEARDSLRKLWDVMEQGGLLRLDVPDHEETLRLFRQTGDEFYIRHLLGPRRNDYGYHVMGYSRERLRNLVEDHGFKFDSEELPNIHFFPAFTLRFRRA